MVENTASTAASKVVDPPTHEVTKVAENAASAATSKVVDPPTSLVRPMEVDKCGGDPKHVDDGFKQLVHEKPAAQTNGHTKLTEVQHTFSDSNWGRPMMVEWSGEEREITDGLACAHLTGGLLIAEELGKALKRVTSMTVSMTCLRVLFMNNWETSA